MGSSHFTDFLCSGGWGGGVGGGGGVGWGQNVGLTDFSHILTLLPPGAYVFHKHMSSYYCIARLCHIELGFLKFSL